MCLQRVGQDPKSVDSQSTCSFHFIPSHHATFHNPYESTDFSLPSKSRSLAKKKKCCENSLCAFEQWGSFHIIYGKEIALQFAPLWHLGLILWENQNLRGDTECLVGMLWLMGINFCVHISAFCTIHSETCHPTQEAGWGRERHFSAQLTD